MAGERGNPALGGIASVVSLPGNDITTQSPEGRGKGTLPIIRFVSHLKKPVHHTGHREKIELILFF